MGVLDILFPKYCVRCRRLGDYLCADCFALLSFDVQSSCAFCQRPSLNGLIHPACRKKYMIDGIFSALVYKGVAKKLLYVFKYRPYVSSLVDFLADLAVDGLLQQESFHVLLQEKPVLTAIPLAKDRQRKRGYNHAELLAKAFAKRLGFGYSPLLVRIRNTPSQFSLSKEERRVNVRGAFVLEEDRKLEIKGKTIFLIDDIVTTGSTLREAAFVLKRSGAQKVFGATIFQDQ